MPQTPSLRPIPILLISKALPGQRQMAWPLLKSIHANDPNRAHGPPRQTANPTEATVEALSIARVVTIPRCFPYPHHAPDAVPGGTPMQRITHPSASLLSRLKTRVHIGLIVVLCLSGLLAMGMGFRRPPSIHLSVETSSDGALAQADLCAVSGDDFHTRRHFRISMNAQGLVIEVYEEDHRTRSSGWFVGRAPNASLSPQASGGVRRR